MSGLGLVNRRLRAKLICGEVPQWVANHRRRDYIIAYALSAPIWVDRAALRRIYADAVAKTKKTGLLHVVDHDIPLTHRYVCGLTVPSNLKVVPWRTNASKRNHWHGGLVDMFSEPEQFSLGLR